MKPPLTVEAKVAEELRTWLASELEQLDASNTNQFAHHVVTILLHEDLDIEDEPLSTGDDFLKDIYNIKQGKTREKQKKAAVQFLRGAVCCDDPMEAEIREVVDELMVKIEETKLKMNTKKALKRSLLVPIAINIEEPGKQACMKSDSSEERYNEAFPSLSGEDSPCKDGLGSVNGNTSVWNCVPSGKENVKVKIKRSASQPKGQRTSLWFSSRDEAHACSVALRVASTVIADSSPALPEAAEVLPVSSTSASVFESPRCWKSAFTPISLTKIFHPIATSLVPRMTKQGCSVKAKLFSPVILDEICNDGKIPKDTACSCQQSKSKVGNPFIPILDLETRWELESSYAITDSDIEVDMILHYARQREKQSKKKAAKKVNEDSLNVHTEYSKRVKTFPDHYGNFWQKMHDCGLIVLYPVLEKGESREDKAIGRGSPDSESDDAVPSWSISSSNTEDTFDLVVPFYPEGHLDEDDPTLSDCSPPYDQQDELDCIPSLPLFTHEDKIVSPIKTFDDDLYFPSGAAQCGQTLGCSNCVDSEFDLIGLHRLYNQCSDTEISIYSESESNSKRIDNQFWCSNSGQEDFLQPWECLWSANAWDNIQQDLVMDMKFQSISRKMAHFDNLLRPSLLSSCLSSEVDQLLQRAFVNSLFSGDIFGTTHLQEAEPVFQCSEVEQYLYSSQRGSFFGGFAERDLIRGQTCSGWLENNCRLGSQCPFSHPSI
ncbi:uncharacterized protein LOC101860219 [Aplysia californica]|uniref:Uncharacterized protein LOC101860219 n=1 Tax=Aplysia californica TaxID=6500 RepID=A0ABM0JCC8_APLCA|nr:uncharacterized protein LOC101860219 [Aplysia californica]XP_005090427.1 uncharacterized protein LOC101860219 [Aplysia californica]